MKRNSLLVALGYLFIGMLATSAINAQATPQIQFDKSVNVGPISIRDMSGQPIQKGFLKGGETWSVCGQGLFWFTLNRPQFGALKAAVSHFQYSSPATSAMSL